MSAVNLPTDVSGRTVLGATGIRLRPDSMLRVEMSNISIDNSVESPLLRLPGEIRMLIWALALTPSSNESMSVSGDICTSRADGCPVEVQHWYEEGDKPIHLLLTCRQVYAEACVLPFALNRFFFCNEDWIGDLARSLPTGQWNAIVEVGVHCGVQVSRNDFPGLKLVEWAHWECGCPEPPASDDYVPEKECRLRGIEYVPTKCSKGGLLILNRWAY